MKQKNDNLLCRDSQAQSDRNISRLVKLADDSNKPSRAFTESLINNALGKLEQLKTVRKREEKSMIIKVSWWEKAMGLAAMIAVVYDPATATDSECNRAYRPCFREGKDDTF